MQTEIPDIKWYTKCSENRQVQPRCPFAAVESCPRYYQSLSLLGNAGSTSIEDNEDRRLEEYWRKSDLWPKTGECETSIAGSQGNPSIFPNFCPEIVYGRFGYFASFIARYADEIDSDSAHKTLIKLGASQDDWGWFWSSLTPVHYTDCQLYSVLDHRSKTNRFPFPKETSTKDDSWHKRPTGIIIIGVIITVISGLILMFFNRLKF